MRTIDVPVGENGAFRAVSVLGFGCSALMGRVGRRESLLALETAVENGINFFDTARSYGYGESESLLGEFFHCRREEVVLCTKFGILPAAKGGWKHLLKPAAQAAVRMIPALRGVARRAAAGDSTGAQFSVATLRASFEISLRELRTDYVDMLLMHEAPASVLAQDDLLEALQRLVEQGKVRMAGLSGGKDVMRTVFACGLPLLKIAQLPINAQTMAFTRETQTPQAQRMLLVANHPFGGAAVVAMLSERLAGWTWEARLPVSLREKLQSRDVQTMPELVLNAVLTDTGISCVVPAMMRPEHLRSNVAAIGSCRFTPEELVLLREEMIRGASAAEV